MRKADIRCPHLLVVGGGYRDIVGAGAVAVAVAGEGAGARVLSTFYLLLKIF